MPICVKGRQFASHVQRSDANLSIESAFAGANETADSANARRGRSTRNSPTESGFFIFPPYIAAISFLFIFNTCRA